MTSQKDRRRRNNMTAGELHEKKLKEELEKLKKEGYRVIDLERKCPDGIAIKDGKVYAVEILGKKHTNGKGWKISSTKKQKEFIYKMFDGVIIRTFKYPTTISAEGGEIALLVEKLIQEEDAQCHLKKN
jgi:hypothetical protein